ncbi:MAG TPA: hypothetical protein VEH10_04375 [Thermoplasmata archaeon]|nr:hypothetical protein [Thermoplasmata archaeon]
MAGTYRIVPTAPRRGRRRRVLLWVLVACVAAIVVEIGAVTDGFGVGGLFKSGGGSSGRTGPDPNPANERITSVTATITYSGKGSDPFPGLNGVDLCVNCPLLPRVNANVTPAVADVWIYFNVTYTGSNTTTISNFTLATSGPDAGLFQFLGVFAGPVYNEPVPLVTFYSGHTTWALAIHAAATSVPDDGTAGYALTFHVTSP